MDNKLLMFVSLSQTHDRNPVSK